jgi:hypothetical protein
MDVTIEMKNDDESNSNEAEVVDLGHEPPRRCPA